jgi:hypothetical protein
MSNTNINKQTDKKNKQINKQTNKKKREKEKVGEERDLIGKERKKRWDGRMGDIQTKPDSVILNGVHGEILLGERMND